MPAVSDILGWLWLSHRRWRLEFLWKTTALNYYLPWWRISDRFNRCQRRNTESRRQQLLQVATFLQTVVSLHFADPSWSTTTTIRRAPYCHAVFCPPSVCRRICPSVTLRYCGWVTWKLITLITVHGGISLYVVIGPRCGQSKHRAVSLFDGMTFSCILYAKDYWHFLLYRALYYNVGIVTL